MISEKFRTALKLSKVPAYQLAIQVNLNPGTLSKWVIGFSKPRPGDERIKKLAELLGLKPHEIFEKGKAA